MEVSEMSREELEKELTAASHYLGFCALHLAVAEGEGRATEDDILLLDALQEIMREENLDEIYDEIIQDRARR